MDGRRHSVDVPISKAIVALRKVRSLRDPSTNSITKFSSLVDNLNWDTNSCNAISLRFGGGCDGQGVVVVEDEQLHKDDASVKHKSEIASCRNAALMPEHKLHPQRSCTDQDDNGLELACMDPFDNQLEGGDSSHEPDVKVKSLAFGGNEDAGREYRYRLRNHNHMRSMGDLLSPSGTSPCASMFHDSTRSPSLFVNEEVNVDRHSYGGCGISCCWSGTPRFRALSLLSDEDNYPLLSEETGDTTDVSGQSRSWKHVTNELVPYSETPRSLSQKFKPKTFSELVGQSVVARSLLGAISIGRIASLYLFHGPRGNGKTSAARIFAAALNCLSLEQHRPCGLCQECLLYFAGRSRDAKEVDSVRINRTNRLRSLIKNATIPPVSSRFKVFIVDECQLLRVETWATLLNSLGSLSRHAVFVMVTSDIDKVPRSAVARSQRYHFPKIKDVDISSRLRKICIEEGLEFEQLALDFVAAKSNGSLRDAEMMLDQLSLLSKQITMTLASELIGTVSDDELLILLDLALSADTSNTVKRARELMRSRIDPMQLISQLANIIMDILAGKLQEESSEVKRSFLQQHASEMDLQKLHHALKILSESEKQLRASKNQTTWLTVALLQLNSINSSLSDPYEPRLSLKATNSRDGDCCSTSSPGERSKHIITCECECGRLHQSGPGELRKTLEDIWMKATEICESNSLKSFLRKRGKLTSLYVKKGLAVAELDFGHADYVSKAEKSWKLIATTLQSVLGRNVEIRINSTPNARHTKARRPSFSFFSCSRRMYNKSQSTTYCRGEQSDCSNFTSNKAVINEKSVDSSLSYPGCGSHIHHICSHLRVVTTIRNSDGNTLSTGTFTPHRCSHDGTVSESCLGSREQHEGVQRCNVFTVQEPPQHSPQHCLSNAGRLNDGLITSDQSEIVCRKMQPQDNIVPSPIHGEASFDAYICSEYPYIICNGSNNDSSDSKHEERSVVSSQQGHCWRTPQLPIKKGWQAKNLRQKSHLVEWVLPCAAAK